MRTHRCSADDCKPPTQSNNSLTNRITKQWTLPWSCLSTVTNYRNDGCRESRTRHFRPFLAHLLWIIVLSFSPSPGNQLKLQRVLSCCQKNPPTKWPTKNLLSFQKIPNNPKYWDRRAELRYIISTIIRVLEINWNCKESSTKFFGLPEEPPSEVTH